MDDGLTPDQVATFERDGAVLVEGAFPAVLAERGRRLLWRDLQARHPGLDPADRSTWTDPVLRLDWSAEPPFVAAGNTTRLHTAFDQLAGEGRWSAPFGLGSWPVRFPQPDRDRDPGDAGWHIEGGFAPDDPARAAEGWWTNLACRGRALLMLFLFSDVGPDDAPTRVRLGSHRDVPPLLVDAGDDGRSVMDVSPDAEAASRHREVALATGRAGDVWLVHPFLVHAAQPHRGGPDAPARFMAQPPLSATGLLDLSPAAGRTTPPTPVERPVLEALGRG